MSDARALLKRKCDELQAFTEWTETPQSQQRLAQLLRVLVCTGQLQPSDLARIRGWKDLCPSSRLHYWQTADDMKAALSAHELPAEFLPLPSTVDLSLIPIADAMYIPRLEQFYKKSDLLKWVCSFRDEKRNSIWPEDQYRAKLSMAELFSIGADPFNPAAWKPPLTERFGKLPAADVAMLNDTEQMLTAATLQFDDVQEARQWLQTLGTLPIEQAVVSRENVQYSEKQSFSLDLAADEIILAMTFSGNDKSIEIVTSASMLYTLDIRHGALHRQCQTNAEHCRTISLSHNEQNVAWSVRNITFKAYNMTTAHVYTFPGHKGIVNDVAFSPTSFTLASASSDKTCSIWNIQLERPIMHFQQHLGPVNALAWSPDGTRIASASQDRTIRIWSPATLRLFMYIHVGEWYVNRLSYAPDGGHVMGLCADSMIRVWNTETGAAVFTIGTNSEYFASAAYSPDGKCIIATKTGTGIGVYCSKTGICMQSLPTNMTYMCMAMAKRDNMFVAAAGSRIQVWGCCALPHPLAEGASPP